jgi:hypothetical protein
LLFSNDSPLFFEKLVNILKGLPDLTDLHLELETQDPEAQDLELDDQDLELNQDHIVRLLF